jgi:hypothetical protein
VKHICDASEAGKTICKIVVENLSNEVDHKIRERFVSGRVDQNGAESSDWSQDLERIIQRSEKINPRRKQKRGTARDKNARAEKNVMFFSTEIWYIKRQIYLSRVNFLKIYEKLDHDRKKTRKMKSCCEQKLGRE